MYASGRESGSGAQALSEKGRRLNIKKATLQEWRAKFPAHLREQGVAANATSRRFRDQAVPARRMPFLGGGLGALHKSLDLV